MLKYLAPLLIFFFISCQDKTEKSPAAPAPVLPIPTAQQIAWQEMEFYAFVHFNMNTFSNMEWGMGDEKPEQFNPTNLDCRQWAKVCKDAGMKGIILTAKHHDGFCLWPSKYTDHSVKNSTWKGGNGDVIRELADACKEYGLKLGIYYSPWDRNHPDYGMSRIPGKPAYLTYMRNQLKELLTNYGEVFEVWFDGANGGTGYYGGANEERRVDKKSYYDWPNTHKLIKELQPNTVIFSDAGPDVRWVGNESGYAFRTMWSNLLRDSVYAGQVEYAEKYAMGQENGTHWVPGETNVSIRPGWYYHEYEDHKVKSLSELVDMYYQSIGRNTTWLLNFPVDKRGLIHENDIKNLMEFSNKIKEDFKKDLAAGAHVSASNERGPGFEAANILDGKKKTYWAAADDTLQASVTITFREPTTFNRFLVQEHIALGQRVKAFSVETKTPKGWEEIALETTIGYKRILRLPETTASAIRINIKNAKACPTLSNLEIYLAPKMVVPPAIVRDKKGYVRMEVPESGVVIYYTLDGSDPSETSMRYQQPFLAATPTVIKATAIDREAEKASGIRRKKFDIAKAKWRIVHPDKGAERTIDGRDDTWWEDNVKTPSNEIVIEFGEKVSVSGITYLPMQDRWISGFIKAYEIYTSKNGRNWKLVAEGEFGNIENSPILQRVIFKKRNAQYLKLKAVKTVDGNAPSFAEIGVVTE